MTFNKDLHEYVNQIVTSKGLDITGTDNAFYTRLMSNIDTIDHLYRSIYGHNAEADKLYEMLINTLIDGHQQRANDLRERDEVKIENGIWFVSNEITGMSLYVDRFCGKLKELPEKINYFEQLGVNFLHLMPLFESPEGESDGGYAVSNFREVDPRFGNIQDLIHLRKTMQEKNMYLMIDIVLNHTSHHHEWAKKAKAGDKKYQDYYYMYDDRWIPNQFDEKMPDIFPESAPGNFTYVNEINKWVMTVFHNYQWDLNFRNPFVFKEMLENILFYANLGIDILRIDAPAFIWKESGTSCQNLPQAHTLLRLIKHCVKVSAPGMALLGEAIVAPKDIMHYFGTGAFTAKECDVAYNATHMALQWDMLATGDTRVMLAAQHEILQKPYGTTWINYTRCHDDIGLGYDDYMIEHAGKNAFEHRKYLKDYYSGSLWNSPARGALFSSNPKTGDARISGSLASLCGLEKALEEKNEYHIDLSIKKILLMQAHSFFLGGIPMIFYGDEVGYTNDYSYLNDSGKSYDNRWMHRPVIDWNKNKKIEEPGTIESIIFQATKKLISLRKQLSVIGDHKNLTWLSPHNHHVAGYLRSYNNQKLYGIFNFSDQTVYLTWYAFKEHGTFKSKLYDYWKEKEFNIGLDNDYLVIEPYGFHLLEPRD
jgi:amylosucrase